jgi:cellobiose phosphorylase
MKRYIVFSGDNYYPIGGWEDFKDSFNTLEEAREYQSNMPDWFHIVDLQTMEIVAKYQRRYNKMEEY